MRWLQDVVRRVDQDVWRQRLRAAFEADNTATLASLAREAKVAAQPPRTLLKLARYLATKNENDAALQLLEQAHREYPAHVDMATELTYQAFIRLPGSQDPDMARALAEVAFEPRSYGAMINLGSAFGKRGDNEAAIACFRKAAEMRLVSSDTSNPELPALVNLTVALANTGRLSEAEVAGAKLADPRIDPREGNMYLNNLGIAYHRQGDVEKAIELHRKALTADEGDRWSEDCLRWVLKAAGRDAEAAALKQVPSQLKFMRVK